MTEKELTTEEKILLSASKVFTEKGFSGTRTRDIAEEAGINLALLNYYFRSKEKLFEHVMKAKIVLLFGQILPIIINEKTNLEQKIDLVTDKYIDILSKNPNLPIFVISEIQKKNSAFTSLIPVKKVFNNSAFIKQILEKQPNLNPLQFLVTFLGMTIFPFVAKPVLTGFDIVNDADFQEFIVERRILVPIWMKTILALKIEH